MVSTNEWNLSRLFCSHEFYTSISKALRFNQDKRRTMMERFVEYQKIHMGSVIREYIEYLNKEIVIENQKLLDYVTSFTEYPLNIDRAIDRINPYTISSMCNSINNSRDTIDILHHLTRRIFFDVTIDNWGKVSVLPDMITPFQLPTEEGVINENLIEIMNRLMKVRFQGHRNTRVVQRNFDNLVEYSCRAPCPNPDRLLIPAFINILKSIFPDFRVHSELADYRHNVAPTRCVNGWKHLPYSESIFLMNIVGWCVLGMYVPNIKKEFITIVSDIYNLGLLVIDNYEIRGQNIRVEHPDEDDIDAVDLIPFEKGDDIIVLQCSHKFRTDTIKNLISSHKTIRNNRFKDIKCPLCREIIGVYV